MHASLVLRIVTGLILLLPALGEAADYVVDSLTGQSASGRGVRGGSFSPSGWTTSAPTDTLWWTIPDALESGSLEFTVSGLSLSASMAGGDLDLVTMYQAPTGVGEPIDYSPYFRNNDMRVWLRAFGAQGGTAAGAIKMEMTQCLVGPPYFNNICPTSCTAFDSIAYANGRITDLGWDGTQSYASLIAVPGRARVFTTTGVDWICSQPSSGLASTTPGNHRLKASTNDGRCMGCLLSLGDENDLADVEALLNAPVRGSGLVEPEHAIDRGDNHLL